MSMRWLWFVVGWLAVAVGFVGVVVPGLPTTVFFVVAAWCFARCSPRFEAWVLGLPRIGPMVRDHRAGHGMPRRAKAFAISSIVVFGSISLVTLRDRPPVAAVVAVALVVGVWYVALRVPTRERVLAEGALSPAERAP